MATVITLFIIIASNSSEAPSLVQILNQHNLLIVGERHQCPESTQLIYQTVTDYLENRKCIIIALEIPSD